MKVSTVIPVYNRQDLVQDAIRAAQSQNVDSHEIVVIDNCSTDATWEVVQGFARSDSRIRCFRNQSNIGPVRNWKKGIQAATGEYCHLLFSDDRIEPGFLSETLDAFDANTAFVLTGHKMLDSQGLKDPSTFQAQTVITREELIDAAIFSNPKRIQLITPLCALFRRDEMLAAIVEEMRNPYGIDFASHGAGPDQLLFLLTAMRYPIVKCVNSHLAIMHAHAGSITIQSRDLSLPREWTRWYFVDRYWSHERERFRAMLWVKGIKNPADRLILQHVQGELGGRVRLGSILEYVTRRLFRLPAKNSPREIPCSAESR